MRAAVASDAPPKYERTPAGSTVDAFDDAIRQQLELVATMPATVIAERVGWTRGITVFKQRVAGLRPAYLPPDPASRTSYVAGDIAQCDFWFPPIELPVGFGQTRLPTQLPVLTMVTGYSRWLSAVLIPTRRAEDMFAAVSQHGGSALADGVETVKAAAGCGRRGSRGGNTIKIEERVDRPVPP